MLNKIDRYLSHLPVDPQLRGVKRFFTEFLFFGLKEMRAWSLVHVSKWSAWALLVVMTFTIVANLKHIKKTIRVSRD